MKKLKYLMLSIFLFHGSCFGNSKHSETDTIASFLSDVQGDYRTTFTKGDTYEVRVLIKNKKEDQSALDRHLKDNPIDDYTRRSPLLEQDQYPLEGVIQIGQYRNHFIYKEPAELDSPVILNYKTNHQILFQQFVDISGEEFFIGEIHFEKRENKYWTLKKIVLWKTGFMIPLFKKKHHIGNFRKVF